MCVLNLESSEEDANKQQAFLARFETRQLNDHIHATRMCLRTPIAAVMANIIATITTC